MNSNHLCDVRRIQALIHQNCSVKSRTSAEKKQLGVKGPKYGTDTIIVCSGNRSWRRRRRSSSVLSGGTCEYQGCTRKPSLLVLRHSHKDHARVSKKARSVCKESENTPSTRNVSIAEMCGRQTDTREQAIPFLLFFHSSSFMVCHFFWLLPHFALLHLPPFTTATWLSVKTRLSLPFSPFAQKQTGER